MDGKHLKRTCLAISFFLVVWGAAGAWAGEDVYDRLYDDDTTATLNFFSNDNFSQVHNLWAEGDVDWALFNADAQRWV